MHPKQRFAWWVGTVGVTAAAAWLRIMPTAMAWSLAGTLQGAGLGGMVWLLLSTPRDAIKLRRETSWLLIGLGVWVQLALGLPDPSTGLLVAAGFIAVLGPVLVWSVILPEWASPWWAVPIVWSPGMVVLLCGPEAALLGGGGLVWLVGLFGVAVAVVAAGTLPRGVDPETGVLEPGKLGALGGPIGVAALVGAAGVAGGVLPVWMG